MKSTTVDVSDDQYNIMSLLQVNYSPCVSKGKEPTLEDILENITSHFIEVSTYTTADH